MSLHNTALMNMENLPAQGFRKLNFLIQNPPFPPETFANLLLLYCKHQYFDLAADVLAENAHLTYKFLDAALYEFLDATLMVQTAPAEAYRKFDDLSKKHIDALRGLTKNIQDARLQVGLAPPPSPPGTHATVLTPHARHRAHRALATHSPRTHHALTLHSPRVPQRDNELIKRTLKLYDDALERYIPVLMAQARIYWGVEHSRTMAVLTHYGCTHLLWPHSLTMAALTRRGYTGTWSTTRWSRRSSGRAPSSAASTSCGSSTSPTSSSYRRPPSPTRTLTLTTSPSPDH